MKPHVIVRSFCFSRHSQSCRGCTAFGDWKIYALKIAGLAGAYFGAARLGLDLAFATTSVTAVWPPTVIALAALLLWGYRLWPGVALGAFLANSWTGIPLYAVLGITLGNTLEALAGAWLLHRVADFRPSLDRVRDARAALQSLVETLPGVERFTVTHNLAPDSAGFNLALFSLFESRNACEIFLRHPEYRRVLADELGPVVEAHIAAHGQEGSG